MNKINDIESDEEKGSNEEIDDSNVQNKSRYQLFSIYLIKYLFNVCIIIVLFSLIVYYLFIDAWDVWWWRQE